MTEHIETARLAADVVAVTPPGTQAVAGDDARAAAWFPINSLPHLAFDHGEIIATAAALLSRKNEEARR